MLVLNSSFLIDMLQFSLCVSYNTRQSYLEHPMQVAVKHPKSNWHSGTVGSLHHSGICELGPKNLQIRHDSLIVITCL